MCRAAAAVLLRRRRIWTTRPSVRSASRTRNKKPCAQRSARQPDAAHHHGGTTMPRISSRSTRKVIRLLKPPCAATGLYDEAPRGLTVRTLIHHQRHQKLRDKYTIAELEGGGLL